MLQLDKVLYQRVYYFLRKTVVRRNCCFAFILLVSFADFAVSGRCQPQLYFDPELQLAYSWCLQSTFCVIVIIIICYYYASILPAINLSFEDR